jgi:hypothetical protein
MDIDSSYNSFFHAHFLKRLSHGGILLCAVLFAATIISCVNEPRIVFPIQETHSTISGFILPAHIRAGVFIGDAVFIDSASTDGASGFFRMDSISYGSYRLIVKAQGFGTYTAPLTIKSRYHMFADIVLSEYPSQINTIEPPDSTVVDSQFYTLNAPHFDSVFFIRVRFNQPIDTQSISKALSITPKIPITYRYTRSGQLQSILNIGVPADIFFSHRKVSVYLNSSLRTFAFDSLEFPVTLTYFPDTLLREKILMHEFIVQTVPSHGAQQIDPSTPLAIEFRSQLSRLSAMNVLTIAPGILYRTHWETKTSGNELLRLTPSQYLKTNTTYSITLDSGLSLGTKISSASIGFSFKTAPLLLTAARPGNDQTGVNNQETVSLTFNAPVDSTALLNSISFTPAVDSIGIGAWNGDSLTHTITHAAFTPNTSYALNLDTTCTDRYGCALFRQTTVRFKTR